MAECVRVLKLLRYTAKLLYLRWGQLEIHPLHPDVPQLVVDIAQLRDKLRDEWRSRE